MKIELSVYAHQKEIVDLEKDWGFTDEEWLNMNENERENYVLDWANNFLEIGYRKIEE